MNNRILIFGDSITWGACDIEGGWATRLKKYTDNQLINGKTGYDEMYVLGVSGDNSDDLVKRFNLELISRIDDEMELVVLIAIGTNDSKYSIITKENRVSISKYKANLTELITTSKKYTNKIVFIGLTPVDDKALSPDYLGEEDTYDNENVQKFNNALIEVAKENTIPMVELFDDLINKSSSKLLSDGLHPNSDGHELIYEKVLAELKDLKLIE
ncbi:MAG: GDSL-type esterase/lipase family protein [bacterium]